MLLIPFCSSWNGQNFSYRNGNTFCSTLDEIPANSGLFRAFQFVSGNFGRNTNLGRYEFWLSFPLLNLPILSSC